MGEYRGGWEEGVALCRGPWAKTREKTDRRVEMGVGGREGVGRGTRAHEKRRGGTGWRRQIQVNAPRLGYLEARGGHSVHSARVDAAAVEYFSVGLGTCSLHVVVEPLSFASLTSLNHRTRRRRRSPPRSWSLKALHNWHQHPPPSPGAAPGREGTREQSPVTRAKLCAVCPAVAPPSIPLSSAADIDLDRPIHTIESMGSQPYFKLNIN